MNILIVDDSKVMRLKLKNLIESTGVPVTSILEAAHGGEALELFDAGSIDIVFTDINMPEMDGRELLRQLAGRKFGHPPYRVVCTTETPQALRDELDSFGVNLYVEKPFSVDVVKKALAEVMAKRSGAK
jgi:two-component system chemotaxis response regulator CheY